MLTFKVPRKQGDDLNDEASDAAAIDCSNDVDHARQEFGPETDVNTILKRFAVTGAVPARRPAQWNTEVDYNLDLQSAIHAVEEVKASYAGLPKELRDAYPTWQLFMQGVAKGEITIKPDDPARTAESNPQKSTGSAEPAGSSGPPGETS